MATLGPGWQMLDSFGFWWTWVNEIWNLSSFLQGSLKGGGGSDFTQLDILILAFIGHPPQYPTISYRISFSCGIV